MNKVILIGNIVRDFELQETSSGVKFARFNLAVSRTYGEKETDFLSIIVWRATAENCAKYLHKGDKIAVFGSIQTRNYEVNGERKFAIDINADTVEFVNTKKAPKEEVQPELKEMDETDDLPF